jgi:uncharacterized protein YqeY
MKDKDAVAVRALRSALAAIGNAEAVDAATVPTALSTESSLTGVGTAEVARRALSYEQIVDIMRAAVGEHQAAAEQYDSLGQPERAAARRAEASVLAAYLSTQGVTGSPESVAAPT